MLNATYLYHSSFAIESSRSRLIFDYFKGNLPPAIFTDSKPVFVFVSHSHYDHFNPVIFDRQHKISKITYILSSDITQHTAIPNHPRFIVMKPFTTKKLTDGPTIISIPATDAGLAYLISLDGYTIYHAGDHANRVRAETPANIAQRLTSTYLNNLCRLFNKVHQPIDLAFVPVVAPFEGDYLSSLDLMIKHFGTKVSYIVPMHLGQPGVDLGFQMKEIQNHALTNGYNDKLLTYSARGEQFFCI